MHSHVYPVCMYIDYLLGENSIVTPRYSGFGFYSNFQFLVFVLFILVISMQSHFCAV